MPRFLVGDDLGSLKLLKHGNEPDASGSKIQVKNVYQTEASIQGQERISVQALAALNLDGSNVMTAAAFSDGNTRLYHLQDDDSLTLVSSWAESRLKSNHFVGAALSENSVFSCTSNGILRRTSHSQNVSNEKPTHSLRALPTRLCDWKLAPGCNSFAYGGEEVALSVWDTEKAFSATSTPEDNTSAKKRKRSDALFPGEIWRAKNPPNDSLSLRQPIRITSIDFVPSSGSPCHIIAGTQAGDIQRYDTRSGRRPIGDWKGIAKTGGIRTLQSGCNKNELFVTDNGSNFYSLDLRNGSILYGYHGIAASITSIAASPTVLVSGAMDQYVRTHSVSPPAASTKERLDGKGIVLEKHFLQCTPTRIVWDGSTSEQAASNHNDDEELSDAEHDVWDELEAASDSDSDSEAKTQSKRPKKKKAL
ncbi:hypothetical protein FA15DRAFT_752036 [Coprinopsis marcescibilis]|uniref:Ribosome biogenesis protein NSA1 n=1 Tax=Coprinopsis marcescibilis TaxID=230819 RepID=A0A5C3LB96_COPMA|nr:hypothetical protein FA15DRAFT_752036 [Coprinopsis marcescibilis]